MLNPVIRDLRQQRLEIEKSYTVEGGHITSPGKFEGEMIYVPYYHEWADYHETSGKSQKMMVEPEERIVFPELGNRLTVRLKQREDGFVVQIKQ